MSTPTRHAAASTRTSPGQTIVLFALASLVLLGALGLALDGGYDYIQRRAMQNVADASALAGASAISRGLTDTEVTQIVLDTAARNGVTDPSQITCTFITNSYTVTSPGITRPCSQGGVPMSSLSDNFTGVLVRAAEQHPTFVFQALGVTTSGTAATSAARVQRPTGIVGGPFMVCGVGTKVYNDTSAAFTGGIYQTSGNYSLNGGSRADGLASCKGGLCPKVPDLNGAPLINDGAYAYVDGNAYPGGGLTPFMTDPPAPQTPQPITGPVYLIHDPQDINPCNDTSSSFKGVNTNVITYNKLTYPAYSLDTPPVFNVSTAKLPPITTGNVSSVQATVNGLNGCQAGQALNNCIMILPVCDASGPGGNGKNAVLAVRSLQAFYIKQTAAGSHTGELIKNYTIPANSDPTYVTGTSGVTVLKMIR
jgi:Flp pilus assembly protein TadG